MKDNLKNPFGTSPVEALNSSHEAVLTGKDLSVKDTGLYCALPTFTFI